MNAVAATEQSNIFKLVAGMFNAAPGEAYLQEFTDAYLALGKDFSALATALGQTESFKALYPENMAAEAFTQQFLSPLGLNDNQEAQDWVLFHLGLGMSHAQVMLSALEAIVETQDPAYASAQKLLSNKAQLAEYYSVQQGASMPDVAFLQATLSQVKPDSDLSSPAAMQALLDAGQASLNPAQPKTLEIATTAEQSSTIVALPEGYEVLISGKNQQVGNYEDQTFNAIAIEAARGPSLKVTLDKTSTTTSSGLEVDHLRIGDSHTQADQTSAVRHLHLVSNGLAAPYDSNQVNQLRASSINELEITGNKALVLKAIVTAGSAQPLVINSEGLSGALSLSVKGMLDHGWTSENGYSNIGGMDVTRPLQLEGNSGADHKIDIGYITEFSAQSSINGFALVALNGVKTLDASHVQNVGNLQINSDQLRVDNWDGKDLLTILPYDAGDYVRPLQCSMELIKSADSSQSTATVAVGIGYGVQSIQSEGFDQLQLQLSDRTTFYRDDGRWAVTISDFYHLDLAGSKGLASVVLKGGAGVLGADLYSTADLVNLGSGLKMLDISGYAGKVTATLSATDAAAVGANPFTQTDVVVKVGNVGMDVTDDHSVARITTFQFTSDALHEASLGEVLQWKISGFQAAHKDAVGLVDNATVLDVSALGIHSLADLVQTRDGADLHISAMNEASHFEIVLAGVQQDQVAAENFKFA